MLHTGVVAMQTALEGPTWAWWLAMFTICGVSLFLIECHRLCPGFMLCSLGCTTRLAILHSSMLETTEHLVVGL
jgi:hypothetical protein